MKTSAHGVDFIAAWEEFRAAPYPDEGGIMTWGFGHAQKKGEAVPKFPINLTDARALLALDLADAEAAVERGITVPLRQYEFDALVSLAFNCGAASVVGSTLARLLNKREAGAVDQFVRWNKVRVNGKLQPSNGLTKRRIAEARMFEHGAYDSSH